MARGDTFWKARCCFPSRRLCRTSPSAGKCAVLMAAWAVGEETTDTGTRLSTCVHWMPTRDMHTEWGWPIPSSWQSKFTNAQFAYRYGIEEEANLSFPRNGFIKEKVACFSFINTIIWLGRRSESFEAVSWQRWRWGGWVGLVTGSIPAPVSTAAGTRRHKSSFFPRSI